MTETAEPFRIERDTMGEVRVPADALWRAQTQRAVENFPVSGRGLEPAHIRALARIKAAAAAVNAEFGVIDDEVAGAIVEAAREIVDGRHLDHFPIDTFQTGSGTSSNMNANEVIATLASRWLDGRTVHPNDEVNASQSSNDVFPSSIHVAATEAVVQDHPRAGPPDVHTGRQGHRVRQCGQGRPHAPDGRDAGHAGPGVPRVRDAGAPGYRTAAVRAPGWASCCSAAPRSAPGSTCRPGSRPG